MAKVYQNQWKHAKWWKVDLACFARELFIYIYMIYIALVIEVNESEFCVLILRTTESSSKRSLFKKAIALTTSLCSFVIKLGRLLIAYYSNNIIPANSRTQLSLKNLKSASCSIQDFMVSINFIKQERKWAVRVGPLIY